MVNHGIRFITWKNTGYFKPLLSPLIFVRNNGLGRSDKLVLGSNWDNIISVMTQWCHHVKYRRVLVVLVSSLEVINSIVWSVLKLYWSWPGIYKPSHTHSYKIMVACNAKLVEVFVSNLHPFIINRMIIMGPLVKVIIKYSDNTLFP